MGHVGVYVIYLACGISYYLKLLGKLYTGLLENHRNTTKRKEVVAGRKTKGTYLRKGSRILKAASLKSNGSLKMVLNGSARF